MCDKEVFVECFSFDADEAFTPRDELLDSVTIAPLSTPISERSPFLRWGRDRRDGDRLRVRRASGKRLSGLHRVRLSGQIPPR